MNMSSSNITIIATVASTNTSSTKVSTKMTPENPYPLCMPKHGTPKPDVTPPSYSQSHLLLHCSPRYPDFPPAYSDFSITPYSPTDPSTTYLHVPNKALIPAHQANTPDRVYNMDFTYLTSNIPGTINRMARYKPFQFQPRDNCILTIKNKVQRLVVRCEKIKLVSHAAA